MRRPFGVALAIASLFLPAAPVAAQSGSAPQQTSSPPPLQTTPSDFLIGQPHGLLAVRGGWLFANTGTDLYDFVTDRLTVDGQDFNTTSLSADFGISIGPRFDVLATLEQAETSIPSQYRDFVDTAGVEITQTTRREEWTISGSVRMALLPRGRRISRFVWVPRTFTPYVGVGGGAVKYDFQQFGSFVDFQSLRVFRDDFSSNGWAPSAHVLGGADLRLYRRLYLTTEARYTWSTGKLSADFVGFEPVGLGGLRTSAGLQIVF
jgi:hypothetical protein